LLAFAMEFERGSAASLALSANTLRVLGETPIPEKDIPGLTGSSAETAGIGWQLKPYIVVECDRAKGRGKLVRLSPRGRVAQQHYHRLTAEIEKRWELRFGKETIRALRQSLEGILSAEHGERLAIVAGLIPPPGTVRAGDAAPALGRRDVGSAAKQRARDLVAQTEYFLKAPAAALPHYPLWDMNRPSALDRERFAAISRNPLSAVCSAFTVSLSPARQIAFEVLRRVEAEHAYASDVLYAALGANVSAADAALATELTMGVLRWRGLLDFLLAQFSKKPIARLDLPVAVALRLGLYQLRFMDKIPARAAVHESVELVKRARKASAATLVNAILRKAAAWSHRPAAQFLLPGASLAERLATLHSHPQWLVEKWLARLGERETVALLEVNDHAPQLACALSKPTERDTVFGELEKAHLQIEPGRLLRNAFSVRGGSPSRTNAFREGRISIQDEASQAVPLLLGTQPRDRVLDLCAAPGGKTAALARCAGPGGAVVAADLHPHRLRAAKAQFERLHLQGRISLVAVDATQPLPFAAQFERILVDAPCSGTGTLARHPEIRWRLTPSQLAEFHRLQVAILRNAISQAAPGGHILYSTCSLEPEENETVIDEVLCDPHDAGGKIRRSKREHAIAALRPHLAASANAEELFDSAGAFRTLRERNGTDGFFAQVMEKIR
jgi:16S rRNA (cytosine967-C5)-methyltransferase